MNARKTIVVTGGAGFVGSHLCERLQREGHRVISLDNYFAGSRDNHVSGVEYREGHTKDIARLIPETPDLIFHLGEYSRVEQSVLEPDIVHDLNIVGTKGVVEFWKSKRCKLVYAGSSTKFGDSGAARYTSPYASTKADNTELVRETGEREGLPYAITYFYNVYGPRERSGVYGTVVEHFKRMYSAGSPCAVVRPGTQERNFTHVSDIVDALIRVGEKGQGDEYGLGNEKAYSIFDLAKLFGFGDNIVMFPERSGNRMTSTLDASKVRSLGWETQQTLPAYIEAFVREHPKGTPRDKRVLVFSTTMHPVAGLAEEAFAELALALPDVAFDVVTARFTKKAGIAPAPNITLHPVGFGVPFDKFLLPFLGPLKALSLWRSRSYLFAWSLMASYATLAGIIFKNMVKAPLLVTLADQGLDDVPLPHRLLLSLMLSQADQVYGTHGAQEKDAMAASGSALPRNTLGEGDAFANALRFAYADIIRKSQTVYRTAGKKILIFSLAYFPKHVGGAEVAIKEITDRIDPEEVTFHLITLRFERDAPAHERIGNVDVYRVGGGAGYLAKMLFIPQAAWKALALNRRYRYDGMWSMMSYMLFPVLIMRALGIRVPFALSLQEGDTFEHMFNRPHVALLRPFLASGFRSARVVQAISTYLAEWARRFNVNAPVVIGNGVDTARFGKEYPESDVNEIKDELGKKMGDVYLITSSRLVKKNAVDVLIKALALLPPNVHALILGEGPDESELRALATAKGITGRVKFLGHVGHDSLPLYLKASDIFVRASRSEGMGNSFIEAMAAGLPVIATQEGGLSDFLFDEKKNPEKPITGWAVEVDSPEDIAHKVLDVMSQREKTAAVVRTARAMVVEKYDWELIAREMREKVFSKLLS